jgi:hypothetical protein
MSDRKRPLAADHKLSGTSLINLKVFDRELMAGRGINLNVFAFEYETNVRLRLFSR